LRPVITYLLYHYKIKMNIKYHVFISLVIYLILMS
jgi:hypothetical protein